MRRFIMLGSVIFFVSALFISAGCKQQVNKPPKAPEATTAPVEAPQPAAEQAAPTAEQAAPAGERQASAEQAAPAGEHQHPAGH